MSVKQQNKQERGKDGEGDMSSPQSFSFSLRRVREGGGEEKKGQREESEGRHAVLHIFRETVPIERKTHTIGESMHKGTPATPHWPCQSPCSLSKSSFLSLFKY